MFLYCPVGMGDDLGMAALRTALRVDPEGFDLADIDPRSTPGFPDDRAVRADRKGWARAKLAELGSALAVQQEMLYATAKTGAGARRRVLLVLQAMDCGGKDGTVKRVAGAMNPLGLRIAAFGPPTGEELSHHYLWRIRREVPAPGYVGVFNRSHYEDVLVVRVHSLVPAETWRGRYDEINEFERELADDGVVLLKVMLHISYDEQRERLGERLSDPTKYWKYNPADVDERGRWREYQAAYNDALTRCSTPAAPWFVVPADRKWYRDWAVANLLLETMGGLGLSYPPAGFDIASERARLAKTANRP